MRHHPSYPPITTLDLHLSLIGRNQLKIAKGTQIKRNHARISAQMRQKIPSEGPTAETQARESRPVVCT